MSQTFISLIVTVQSLVFLWAQHVHSNPESKAQVVELEALQDFKNNKLEKVISSLNPNITEISESSLRLLALTYAKKGDHKNQIRILKFLTQNNKKNPKYFYYLAKAYYKLSQKKKTEKNQSLKQAIEQLQKALQISKKHEKSYDLLVQILKESTENKSSDILSVAQDKIKYLGSNQRNQLLLCEAYYLAKFLQSSLDLCLKMSKKFPKEPLFVVYYALSLENEIEKESLILKTANKHPKNYTLQLEAGKILYNKKNYKRAIQYFKKAINFQPESDTLNHYLGSSFFYSGNYKKGYEHLFKACMLNKQKFIFSLKKAKAYLNRKRESQFEKQFKQGILTCFEKA